MRKLLLTCASVVAAFGLNAQTSTPVVIASGFNEDCVAEDLMNETTDKAAHPCMDGHHSAFVVNDGMLVISGLPQDGALTTEEGHKYQLASYSSDNCLYLAKGGDAGTLVFQTPVQASQLGFLVVGANKDATDPSYTATVNYTDGTSTTTDKLSVCDWGENWSQNDYVFTYTQRFRADAGSNPENGRFNISESIIDVNHEKKVESVKLTSTCVEEQWGWGMLTFMAVTAINGDTAIDGIEADNDAVVTDIYSVDGVRHARYVKGLNIVKYSDGSVRKLYR